MTTAADLRSGKGSGDENFPVASRLIAPKHRPAIFAFYEFVRVADDIADHATLAPSEKLARPAPRATPALMHCIRDLAIRTGTLLDESRPFAMQIHDRRLAMEVAAIQNLAERLVGVLCARDPLSERVHLSKPQMLLAMLTGAAGVLSRRLFSRTAPCSAFAR